MSCSRFGVTGTKASITVPDTTAAKIRIASVNTKFDEWWTYGPDLPITVLEKIPSPAITTQPQSVTVPQAGSKAVFTAAAEGDEPLTYTWFYRNEGASKWTKSSITGTKFTLIVSQDREVYCQVTDSAGNNVNSEIVKAALPENAELVLTPDSALVANTGDKVSFTAAGGTAPYTWYYRNAGASKWSKSSVAANKFTIVVSGDREVYCVSGDGKQSDVATAAVAAPGNLKVAPANASVAKAGDKAVFTVSGGKAPYDWYYRNAGAVTWTKSSVTGSKFTIIVGKDREVFCASGGVRSEVVTAGVSGS